MNVDATDMSFGELLKDNNIYVIPEFQRSYAWKNDEIEEFWNDLYGIYINEEDIYFIGSMVFTPYGDKDPRLKILDGQQRFATIMLFLSALRENLRLENYSRKNDWINSIDAVLTSTDIPSCAKSPKLELNRYDKSFFEKIIIKGIVGKPEYESHVNIQNCFYKFKDKVKMAITEEGEKFVEGCLESIFKKFIIIKIEVDTDINAHILFETLNDRGLELCVADLTKNYIFSISGQKLEDSRRLWEEIVSNVGDKNITKFLRHYWMSTKGPVMKEKLYKNIRKEITSTNVAEHMEKISKSSYVYSNIVSPTHEFWGDNEIEALLEELKILKVDLVHSLILSIYDIYYVENKSKFKELLRLLINFSFRYNTICVLPGNELERLYTSLSLGLRKNQKNWEDIIKELKKISPDQALFLNCFSNFSLYNGNLARYVLKRICKSQLDERGQKELTIDSMNVNWEHIIPKKPNAEWLKFFKEREFDNYLDYINKIGNQTLLLEEYNSKISNYFFDKKQDMYKKSVLPINEYLKTIKQFSREEVETRQSEFGKIADKIWGV